MFMTPRGFMTPREEINFYWTIAEAVEAKFPDYQRFTGIYPHGEDAIDLLSRFLKLRPNDIIAYFLRAKSLESAGKYDKALIDYEYILKINPNRFDVMICCWLPLLFKLKWFQKAISILVDRLQIETEPYRIAYIHLRIALVYYKMRHFRLFELHMKLSEQFRLIARSENKTV
jgi:tetratricopeptide (TPR) repeat protein